MPNRQFLMAMVLVLSVFALLQGYAFFSSIVHTPKQDVANVQSRAERGSSQGSDFTWKKFVNEKYGFSFEIPPLYGASYDGGAIYGTEKVLASAKTSDVLELNDWTDCEGGIFFKAAVKNADNTLTCEKIKRGGDCLVEDVVINGRPATQFSCKSYKPMDDDETSIRSSMHQGLCVKNGDKAYELELKMLERTASLDYKAAVFEPSADLFAKVVSSFRVPIDH